jgi:hypothetical protein
MIEVAHKMEEADEGRARERRISSREVMPDNRLIRFVADPQALMWFPMREQCQSRGLWVEARDAVNKAVEKSSFPAPPKSCDGHPPIFRRGPKKRW